MLELKSLFATADTNYLQPTASRARLKLIALVCASAWASNSKAID
jgi:hypothetical protein